MPQKIAAFVAKSFDPVDEAKIDPIIKLLDSFKPLGFIVESADRAEVESVSEKVRALIDKSDVLVGIFTKRHAVYRLNGRLKTAWNSLSGKLAPTLWSAPPWVLQESGYALKGNKDLILFREIDVEIPGLQGDLEYISYDPRNPAPALQRASEMISTLIAKAGGIKVETLVGSQPIQVKEAEGTASPKPTVEGTKSDEGAESEDITGLIHGIFEATYLRNWELAKQRYELGLKRIREKEPHQEIFWKSLYQWARFSEGMPDALPRLRDLVTQAPDDNRPLRYLAFCLVDLHEYEEAVDCYLRAAAIAKPIRRASLEIEAAETLHKAKKPGQAKQILLGLLNSEYAVDATTKFSVLKQLYSLYKESEDKFACFAIAESALHQAPEEMGFRFSLAYDYDEGDQSPLALYHYKIIFAHDEKNLAALHNLAVASSKTDLPVLAAQRYKRAYELGETLAASNLAHEYLKAGLADDAIALLKSAQSKGNCVPEVSRTLATVYERIEENNHNEEKVLAAAEEHRNFLLPFADGLLSPIPSNLGGRWSFQSGDIELKLNGSELTGSREDRTQSHTGLANLFPTAPKTTTKIEKFQFSGTMSGRTCRFKLDIEKTEEPPGWSFLGSLRDSKTEGYILFAEDGQSANAVELKAGKPEKYYKISKAK